MKPLKSNNVFPFPASENATGKKAGKKGSLTPRQRAAKALANAKQRCTNPNDPNYANYGASGIKVLFKNVDALIAAIDLPPPGTSLDRINPKGHYEPENVRWATAALQAQNKKNSPLAGYPSTAIMIAKYKAAAALPAERRRLARSWITCVGMFNQGYLSVGDLSEITQRCMADGALAASFELNQEIDLAAEPGVFHLPALSLPDARVRLRGGPFRPAREPRRWTAVGGIYDLSYVPLALNVPERAQRSFQTLMHSGGPGLTWLGQPSMHHLRHGWFETWALALTSRLQRAGRSAAAFPVLTVRAVLNELGSTHAWDFEHHPVLGAGFLFIPDFQVDCGGWGSMTGKDWGLLEALLDYRAEHGGSTVVGIQNLHPLTPALKQRLIGTYRVVEFTSSPELPMPEGNLPDIREDRPLEALQCNFRSLQENLATRRLMI